MKLYKNTLRVSLSIGVKITRIRCVFYLLQIFKMFHGLMNNTVQRSRKDAFALEDFASPPASKFPSSPIWPRMICQLRLTPQYSRGIYRIMAGERSLIVRGSLRRRSIHGTFPGARYSDMLLGLVCIAQRREGAQGMRRECGVEGRHPPVHGTDYLSAQRCVPWLSRHSNVCTVVLIRANYWNLCWVQFNPVHTSHQIPLKSVSI
jgi:hypothetical protein